MTDRELLEAAAKAAGIEYRADSGYRVTGIGATGMPLLEAWDSLTDDGDALRLAVSMRLTVAVRHHECEVFDEDGECLASEPIFSASAFISKDQATDPYAATRRAITRAAAAMAKDAP